MSGKTFANMFVREMIREFKPRNTTIDAAQLEKNEAKLKRLREDIEKGKERIKKQEEKQIQAQLNAVKAQYVCERTLQEIVMTRLLEEKYAAYFNFSDLLIRSLNSNSLESMLCIYTESQFQFNETMPVRSLAEVEVPILEKVPKESFLETFSASKREKRLAIISENERLVAEAEEKRRKKETSIEEQHTEQMISYNIRLKEAKRVWEENEFKKKAIIEEKNQQILKWIEDYRTGGARIIVDYAYKLIEENNIMIEPIDKCEIGYNEYTNKMILEISLIEVLEIFPVQRYRYIEKTDEIKAIKFTSTDINEHVCDLVVEICIALVFLLYKKDEAKHIRNMVVNIKRENVYYGSCEISKEEFSESEGCAVIQKGKFTEMYIRVFKQISRGVKPFDAIGFLE